MVISFAVAYLTAIILFGGPFAEPGEAPDPDMGPITPSVLFFVTWFLYQVMTVAVWRRALWIGLRAFIYRIPF